MRAFVIAMQPGPNAQRGITLALLGGGVTAFVMGVFSKQLNFPAWLVVLAALLIGLGLVALAFPLLRWSLTSVMRLPVMVLAAGVLAFIMFSKTSDQNLHTAWPLVAGVLLTLTVVGAALGSWRDEATRGQRWVYATLAVLVLAGNALFVGWLAAPRPAPLADIERQHGAVAIDAPNPALPGPYSVSTLSYGSGEDRWRPEYGIEVDIETPSVNAAGYVVLEGWEAKAREWFWGFGREAVPRNALVWLPEGEGPFPLVLIAHGNHSMTDFSESGYAYLGELLASRGYIVASVDMNFLNGGVFGAVSGENDARAWLLLQHIDLWEEWNRTVDSPFYQQVDMHNIALIGHSRGGEAVALAAAFNDLGRNPNNAAARWSFNFGIKAVVALAPVDGQHQPGGSPVALHDITYLVLQGSADADVSSFYGLRQYERATFSEDSAAFKAAVYIYGANHAQFNTDWGRVDLRAPRGWLLHRAELISGEDQRAIASVYISALLDGALKDDARYRELFVGYHNAGEWLPPTLYANLYAAGGAHIIAGYEEDIDVTSATDGGRISAVGLTRWREVNLPLRGRNRQDNTAVEIGWNDASDRYILDLAAPFAGEPETWLVFNAANADGDSLLALDLAVRLTDSTGQNAHITLNDYFLILPQFPAAFSYYRPWAEPRYPQASQPVLQSYRIALADFAAHNPDFDLSAIRRVEFVFDQTPSGRIYLDDVGFDD